MKKLFLCAALAVFGFSNVGAQDVTFGAKAGVNFASFGGDLEDLDGRTSFHLGVVAEFAISEKFSVQPELLFSGQGAGAEFSETFFGETISSETTFNLSYLNLPIMAKYYVADGFSLEAGPYVGFLIGGESEETFSGGGESGSETEDSTELFKGLDFGLGVGTSYKLESGLFFSARYNLGLADITDADDGDDAPKINNNVIQISVGYFFL
ncbi:MAG: porin family protein [Psychroserpens sp.]|uniref:porin family protein n=1 Tax=Psychroserpens sp. TaxID=2020870 RepID=UPI003C716FE2